MVVGIIPARKGSKGIPDKNIRLLSGYHLIQWVVTAAKAARLDEVWVTTDNYPGDISYWAFAAGAQILKRPDDLAKDDTPDLPVFQHALRHISRRKWKPSDLIVHLRPTSPFVRPEDIDSVVHMLREAPPAVESVRSIRSVKDHPAKMYREHEGRLWPWDSQDHTPNHPRQGLEPAWVAAGFVDAVRATRILDGDMQGAHGYVLPWYAPALRAVDLDLPSQWAMAEQLAKDTGWRPGHVN